MPEDNKETNKEAAGFNSRWEYSLWNSQYFPK